ncbi:MAG: DUF3098 domain-containing protein [Flavobacterium sp.]|nr:MAG: DUF3098 domain-containing protein [Flavobacterium sp.]
MNTHFLFEKVNYKILLIGIAVIALGFILMSGGGSDDPKVFSEAIFNFRRIRLAPTVVLIGFGITIYAILKNPHAPVKNPGETFPEEAPIKNFKK